MEFESIVEAQAGAMLEAIELDLAQRREAILGEARQQARMRLKQARTLARRRLAEAIEEERGQWRSSLRRAGAALASRLRRKQQELDRERLELGEQQLRVSLVRRWEDPAARREWAMALLEEAHSMLPHTAWRIDYAPGIDAAEAESLFSAVSREMSVGLSPKPEMAAGFCLYCGDACLDMTIDGLLARSNAIDSQLLAEIHEQQRELRA